MNFIIDNFDKLFNSEESLKRLEEIILDLAVKGKLVPQDPKDEPASILLEKIKAEKEQLIKDKKIKKDKDLAPIIEEEKPFGIPTTWQWVRLGEIINLTKGKKPNNLRETNGQIPYIDVNAFDRKIFNFFTDEENIVKCNKDEILIICDGSRSGYIGRAETGALGSTLAKLEVHLNYDRYIEIFIKSRFTFLNSSMKGARIPHLDVNLLKSLEFPLPPLAEQKRIVEKVDKLKELINQFREKIQKRDKVRQGLKASIMNEIEKSNSNHDLLENLELIFRNFDTVVKTKEDIKDIRDLVLSLAVKGKLVPQDPNEEPASVLLEKIKTEKEQLIKDKKIKKNKDLAPITDEEIPFEIPESWEWVRLGEIVEKLGSGSTPTGGKNIYLDEGIKFIRSQNVYNDGLRLDTVAYISEEINELKKGSVVKAKDVLLNITGGSIGRCSLVPSDFDIANVNQHVMIIRLINLTMREYIHFYITSNYIQNLIMAVQVGVSREGLSGIKLANFCVPIPPLAEQKRIVLQVEKLMKVCDELEKLVEKSQKEESLLIGSIMNGLVG